MATDLPLIPAALTLALSQWEREPFDCRPRFSGLPITYLAPSNIGSMKTAAIPFNACGKGEHNVFTPGPCGNLHPDW